MAEKFVMTKEKVLKAAGVTDAEITAIKTADATTAVNTLDAIYNKLMSFVATQRVEMANLNNPLRVFEKSYASLNGGKLNGMFQEILLQPRAKGTNGLYGGKAVVENTVRNPYTSPDFGTDPLTYVYRVNSKIERYVEYNRDAFRMALMEGSLNDFIGGQIAMLEVEGAGSRYAIENNVLNCENYQYDNYANVPVFEDAATLNEFMHKVWKMQSFPESNMEFKRVKYNTTRQNPELFFVLNSEFAFKFAQDFTFKQYLKPFLYRSEDSDNYGVQAEWSRIVEVDKLTPTTLAANAVLDPLNMTAATLPANTELVGRIIDWNAVKFGLGLKSAVSYPLSSRVSHYDESQDACFDMCPAYVNVPILINKNTFDSHRKIHIIDDTPATPPAQP